MTGSAVSAERADLPPIPGKPYVKHGIGVHPTPDAHAVMAPIAEKASEQAPAK